MTLSDYIHVQGLSAHQFAERLGGVTASGVTKWARGDRVPRPDQMRRIYEVTGGVVSPNDFFLIERSSAPCCEAEAS